MTTALSWHFAMLPPIRRRDEFHPALAVLYARMAVQPTDEELMLAYARGDLRAFDALYARTRGLLYRFILRSAGERTRADDLFQETWSRAIAARERYRPEAKFSTWLLQIAHNLIVDSQRRTRPQADADETATIMNLLDAPAHERPDAVLGDFEERRRLQLALDALPPEQREAFMLRIDGALGLDAIATITGAPHETVKSRLRYAFAKIRGSLAE